MTVCPITLTDSHIVVGNSSNQAADVAMSGDVTINDTGVTTIKTNVALAGSPTTTTQTALDNSTKIATTAYADRAVTTSKSLTSAYIFVGDVSNIATGMQMTGDISISNTGVTAIKSNVALAGSPTTTTQTQGNNSTKIATTAYVDAGLSGKSSSSLTSGHLFVGNASNVATDTAITGDVTISNAGVTTLASNLKIESFGITINGGGSILTTGSKGYITLPYAGTITNWYMAADQTGDCVIDLKTGGSSIVGGGNKPTLSSSQAANASISGWTTPGVSVGEIIEFNLDSVSLITRVNLVVTVALS